MFTFGCNSFSFWNYSMKKTIKGIDYSKWDKMDFSDDDDESANSEQNIPRVTRLDEPSRVTCYNDGSINIRKGETKKMAEVEKQIVKSQIDCRELNVMERDDDKQSLLTWNGRRIVYRSINKN